MEVTTLNELFFNYVENHPKPDALMYKSEGEFKNISTEEFSRRVRNLSMALVEMGMKKGDRIALLCENRPEWPIADLAIMTAGGVTVPIYPTLLGDVCEHILRDSEAAIILLSSEKQLRKIEAIRSAAPGLKTIITFDVKGSSAGGAIHIDEIYARGEEEAKKQPDEHKRRAFDVRPDDLATFIYTSGTTGIPKGAMLTHDNILSNVKATSKVVPLGPEDVALSFLPLSHVLERMALYMLLYNGCTIAYAESIEAVPQNMQEVWPTIVVAVPRFYEKLHARIMESVRQAGGLKKKVFDWAIGLGKKRGNRILAGKSVGPWLGLKYAMARRLAFSKLKERTGGRLRLFVSGGAPLPREIGEFFYATGLTILEGYGLTETSPVIAVNAPRALRFGTVGRPIEGVEVRVAQDGEILCRGPNVMRGYHNMPGESAEALKNGWFHTGDIGHLDRDGYLVITDRKKDLIKTSGGKYVAPQPLENQLRLSEFVSNAVVVGNRRSYCCVLIVPNFERLKAFFCDMGARCECVSEFLKHPSVVSVYEQVLEELNRGKASFETLKKFALLESDFTIDSGEITPTMKVKRRIVEEKFKNIIDGLYSEPV